MVDAYNTIPAELMPDERKIDNYEYAVSLRFDFNRDPDMWREYVGDLTVYYTFAEESGIFMEHNILRTGYEDGIISRDVRVCFYFLDAIDAMAFKLRWK